MFSNSFSGALTRDNRYLWMANQELEESFGGVYILDTATGGVTHVNLGFGTTLPLGSTSVAFSPNGQTVYLSVPTVGLLVMDSGTRQITRTLPENGSPFSVVVSPDGSRIYLSRALLDSHGAIVSGWVTVINAATLAEIATIPTALPGAGLPLAITSDSRKLLVSAGNEVDVIDSLTLTVSGRIPLPGAGAIAITTDGKRAFVASGVSDVSVIDTETNTVLLDIPLGSSGQIHGLALAPDGSSAWVVGWRFKSRIDTSSYAVEPMLQGCPNDVCSSFNYVVFENRTPTLSGTWSTPSGTQNLTTLGSSDWAHWGMNSSISFNHKATGSSQISNYAVMNGEPGSVASFSGVPAGYKWTDGTPTSAVALTTTGVYIGGAGKGFRISVPVDAAPRAITVFVGVYGTQGRLVAHLSDNSAADFVDTSLNSSGSAQRAYTITYQAASAGQTLTITFTNAGSGGNVNLQAAALTSAAGLPPDFTLSAQVVSSTVMAGNSATYTVSTGALNGFNDTVGLSVSGLPSGAVASFSPPTITGSGSSTLNVSTLASTPPGTVTLSINGTSGLLTHIALVPLTVNSPGGGSPFMTGSLLTPTGTQNLTALGQSDWAHWGLIPVPSFDHKATGATQIRDYTVVNGEAGMAVSFTGNPVGFAWTDGSPHGVVSNTATGVYISGAGRGFQISVPADTTPRTVTIYVGLYATTGKMTAHLSDNTVADFVDLSFSSGGSAPAAYVIHYQAASAGQKVTLTFVNAGSGGNVNLQAAALSTGP
ncbi:MAG: DUF5074 domain-containing protein [Bryobacteraceae bacterium]